MLWGTRRSSHAMGSTTFALVLMLIQRWSWERWSFGGVGTCHTHAQTVDILAADQIVARPHHHRSATALGECPTWLWWPPGGKTACCTATRRGALTFHGVVEVFGDSPHGTPNQALHRAPGRLHRAEARRQPDWVEELRGEVLGMLDHEGSAMLTAPSLPGDTSMELQTSQLHAKAHASRDEGNGPSPAKHGLYFCRGRPDDGPVGRGTQTVQQHWDPTTTWNDVLAVSDQKRRLRRPRSAAIPCIGSSLTTSLHVFGAHDRGIRRWRVLLPMSAGDGVLHATRTTVLLKMTTCVGWLDVDWIEAVRVHRWVRHRSKKATEGDSLDFGSAKRCSEAHGHVRVGQRRRPDRGPRATGRRVWHLVDSLDGHRQAPRIPPG